MTNIKWLGPYTPTDRHADSVTIDHIIDLRKQILALEKRIENLQEVVRYQHKHILELIEGLDDKSC